MKNIKGLKINHLDFHPLKMGDFLYYEGPLLSHFIDKNKPSDHYFYRWVDFNDDSHRWLIFKSSEKDIKLFLCNDISLWDMINKNSTITLVDLDDDLNKKQIIVTTMSELPESYLPSEKSYYKEEQYHHYTVELKNQLSQKETENKNYTELLKKVDNIDEQQQQTFKLLTEFFSAFGILENTHQTSKYSNNLYQDDLLNQIYQNNFTNSKSW